MPKILCVEDNDDNVFVIRGRLARLRLEVVVEDDRSEPATAARIYEKLITQSKEDAVLRPYSSPITASPAPEKGERQ